MGVAAAVFAMVASTVLAGATLAQDEKTINVAIVGNPQMEDIASLTPDLFTAETGINVNYVVLEEQTLREIVTRSARILAVDIAPEAAIEIARRSRGTPRIANRLLRRVRDFAQVRADGRVTLQPGDVVMFERRAPGH